jgi:hypothetical protein
MRAFRIRAFTASGGLGSHLPDNPFNVFMKGPFDSTVGVEEDAMHPASPFEAQ